MDAESALWEQCCLWGGHVWLLNLRNRTSTTNELKFCYQNISKLGMTWVCASKFNELYKYRRNFTQVIRAVKYTQLQMFWYEEMNV